MARPPRRLVRTIELISGRVPLPAALSPAQRALFERLRELVLSEAIVGVAISEKEIDGGGAGEDGIVFYVREKTPRSKLDPGLLVPPVIMDVQGRAILTDVRAVGDVEAQLNVAASPIRSGFSLGHKQGTAGTLGAVVRRGGHPHLLSAKHVLANNGLASPGDPVFYPSPEDGGQSPGSHVASLIEFESYITGAGYPNATDAALARVLASREADLERSVPGAEMPLVVADPVQHMAVHLLGRTSDSGAHSVVKGVSAIVRPYFAGVGKVGFYDQVECPIYTKPGDSGALVIATQSGAVVGLHIAGSATNSFFTPIKRLMTKLGFSF